MKVSDDGIGYVSGVSKQKYFWNMDKDIIKRFKAHFSKNSYNYLSVL